MNNYEMYAETFVECGDGWRWRFAVVDESGLFSISSQTWSDKEKKWVEEFGNRWDGQMEAIPQIIDALKTLAANNDLP